MLAFSDLRICCLTQIQSRQSDLLPQQARAGKFPIQTQTAASLSAPLNVKTSAASHSSPRCELLP